MKLKARSEASRKIIKHHLSKIKFRALLTERLKKWVEIGESSLISSFLPFTTPACDLLSSVFRDQNAKKKVWAANLLQGGPWTSSVDVKPAGIHLASN